ncbi:hypothetical protein MKW92_012111 [Papaver armeniacum]|nr:hypothetical protein MKW92_012111 [Papaver armeniacum]
MGDVLSVHFPNSGRIILSQISAGSFISLAWILMLGLPDDPSTAFKHGFVPIFAEIVPEKSRTSIYALDRSFENILASFAPPIVGLLFLVIHLLLKGQVNLLRLKQIERMQPH